METYLSELNEAQKAPVLQKDGAMMVIAGAGSGKTRVLTYRIAYLIKQGVDPFNILALTFTNKAALEMKNRIAKIIGYSDAKKLWMGTFHSVFAKILRFESSKLGFPANFSIYDQQDSERLIGAIIKELNLDTSVYKKNTIQSKISKLKNNLITVNEYFSRPDLQEIDQINNIPRFGEIYDKYTQRCFKASAMDFDDLLLKTNELLSLHPEVLAKYQDRFKYILVDEYQDTNHSQYLIVKALSDKFQNICIVGDDAQSIYAFRGANIENIFNFQRDYKQVNVYRLEQNYRSTGHIVQAANSVIKHNQNRLEKNVWTSNNMGNPILVYRNEDESEEGRYVASSIFENKMRYQLHNRDFAVLYRTNSQARAIEDALRKRDIPYRIYGGISFYQRQEVKDVIAYFRLILNPNDEEALKRTINTPSRGIGSTTLTKLLTASQDHKCSIFELIEKLESSVFSYLNIRESTRKKLQGFYSMIQYFRQMSTTEDAYSVSKEVLQRTGLILEMKKDKTPEGISRINNIEELLNGIKDFVEGQKEIEDATGSLSEYIEDIALATDLDKNNKNDNKVALMTIHLAKGLEFPYIYIVGMEENLFPSAMSIKDHNNIEEERRLFYVALTRGEKQVYLSYCERRNIWGKLTDCDPSRFIDEIDKAHIEYINPSVLMTRRRYNYSLSDKSIDKSKLRLHKPVSGVPPLSKTPSEHLRRLKPLNSYNNNTDSLRSNNSSLKEGMLVEHNRFGRGKILKFDGVGNDRKAEIQFEVGGIKKLILRFAKLSVISNS